MMCVSEFSFGEYITLSILSTNEPFLLRKDGSRAFPPRNPSAKRGSGTIEPSSGFRRLGGPGAKSAKFSPSDNPVSQALARRGWRYSLPHNRYNLFERMRRDSRVTPEG
jgi:hypothetical protein